MRSPRYRRAKQFALAGARRLLALAGARRLLRDVVYTDRATLAAGLKRRGDFGFIPRRRSREFELLASLDLRGKHVYDIGGHIGLIAMHFARATGETGSVTTFEPHPHNVRRILDHIELNGFKNIRVFQMGLGGERGELDFVVDRTFMAQGTFVPERQKLFGKDTFKVPVDTLDNVIREHGLPPPDFVKMDVEGFELEVLHGMDETIRKYKPAMQVELHGVREHEVARLLLSYGYQLLQVEDGKPITAEHLSLVRGHLYAN